LSPVRASIIKNSLGTDKFRWSPKPLPTHRQYNEIAYITNDWIAADAAGNIAATTFKRHRDSAGTNYSPLLFQCILPVSKHLQFSPPANGLRHALALHECHIFNRDCRLNNFGKMICRRPIMRDHQSRTHIGMGQHALDEPLNHMLIGFL
jgi:hypothetical protein